MEQPPSNQHSVDDRLISSSFEGTRPDDRIMHQSRKLDVKWQRRLYWIVPLAIIAIVLVVLFEVYKSDFERWVQPLTNWLVKRESWSWIIPVIILFILSFPPLFGHEIVQLIVGLTYPLGVAIGIACAGSILGEAGCFVVFKYFFTQWVDRKIATQVKWAATARIAQEAGYKGVLVIRYSIIPPHLANPLFACTGMKFWIYMTTVILSLPKAIIFVALGTPGSKSKAEKYAKVIAILVLVVITIFASRWIQTRMMTAIKEIEAERGISQEHNDLDPLTVAGHDDYPISMGDTSYQGAVSGAPQQYPSSMGDTSYQGAVSGAPQQYPTGMGDTSYQGAVSGAPQQYPTGTGDTSYRGAVTTAPPRYESAGLMENTSYEGSNNY